MKALKGGWKELRIITSKTTKDDLYLFDRISNKDKIIVYNKSDKFVEFTPSKVDELNFINTLDIFGDGSCIATYTLDGNANDLSGNHNGTWYGSEQYDTGKFDQCAKFNGNNSIKTGVSSFPATVTLSFWFKQGEIDTSAQHCLFSFFGNGKNILNLWQYTTDLKKKMFFDINQGESTKPLPLTYEDNLWHHLVVDTLGNVYVDGEKVLEIPSVDLSTVDRPLLIGGDWDPDNNNPNDFACSGTYVDQIRIFNRILSEEEIKLLSLGEKYYHCQLSYLSQAPEQAFRKESFSIWVSTPFEQEETDSDWNWYQIEVDEKPREVKIVSADVNEIKTVTEVLKGENLLVCSNNEVIEKQLDGYPDIVNTVNVLDVFNDGSCIATYTLDGDPSDLGGKYNGLWKGSEQYEIGKFGKCAKFDGGSYIELQNSSTALDTTKPFTISLWGKFDTINDKWSRFFDKYFYASGTTVDRRGVIIARKANSNEIFTDYGISGSSGKIISYPAKEKTWYHLVVTFDGKTLSFYVNSVLVGSESISTPTNADKNATIGSGYDGGGYQPLVGSVDQVRIFNRPLSEEEIKALYKEELYKIDISSFNLTNPPTKAWKEPTKVYVALESNSDRCLWKDEDISDKIQNATTSSFEFQDIRRDLVKAEDSLIINGNNVKVNEVTPKGSWDTSTMVLISDYSVGKEETNPGGIFFRPDGSKMYIVGYTNATVYQYNLSTPWDVTTASLESSKSIKDQDSSPQGIFFYPDGTKMYIVGSWNDKVYQYNLSTPWDVTTATFVSSKSIKDKDNNPRDLFFHPDGSKMYIVGDGNNTVYQYNLSTPWDVTTASLESSKSIKEFFDYLTGISFNPTGDKMYVVGTTDPLVCQYNLSTPWDVTTATFVSSYKIESKPQSIFFHPNGDKVYILSGSDDKVHQYLLPINYQIKVPEQPSTITSVIIPQRITLQTLQNRTYLTDQDIIRSKYQTVNKKGRALRVKLEGIENTYVDNFKVNLWTE